MSVAGSLVIVLDKKGRIVRFNRACERVTGYSFEELRGKPLWTYLIPPEEMQQVQTVFESLAAGAFPNEHENDWLTKAGGRRRILWSNTALLDGRGAVEFVIATGIDVTERKRAEQALREAHEELERRVDQRTRELRAALDELARLKERLEVENVLLREEVREGREFDEIVGQSPALRSALYQVGRVAGTDTGVLILGETGTGKELVARAIHYRSPRKDRPLIKVNCAALPPTLIESELFGHERGSFTGAVARKAGRFELADGGTLFLDEIGDVPLELQTKLLRVLQDGEFEPVGSTVTRKVNVRIIAATNQDLELVVQEGRFRSDLYFRLAVFPIVLPPLRDRREDIPLLTWHFIAKKQSESGRIIERIHPAAMDRLMDYAWPGNVRELQNVVERALILSPGSELVLDDAFRVRAPAGGPAGGAGSLQEIERAHILGVLKQCGWKVKGRGNAAERLGLNSSTLRDRMKRLGIARS